MAQVRVLFVMFLVGVFGGLAYAFAVGLMHR